MASRTVTKTDPKTGKEEIYYETSRTMIIHWATVFVQVCVIGAMMVGILKYGVTHSCKDVINEELMPPGGSIYVAMANYRSTCRVDQSIRPMENTIIKMQTVQEQIQDDIRELKVVLDRIDQESRDSRKNN